MSLYKHVIGGPGPAGDVWSSSIHSSSISVNLEAAHSQFQAAWSTAWGAGGIGATMPNLTVLNVMTTYQINPTDGKALFVVRTSPALIGTGGAGQPSPRDALVVGLRTDVPGPAGRGRMFLPGLSNTNVGSTGLMTTGPRDTIAAAVAAFIGSLRGSGQSCGIYRLGLTSVVPFTSVTVGAIHGSQRRRTNKIPAGYRTALV